jgi:RsmE family RNA methyltransferase
MNLILLEPDEVEAGSGRVTGRRARHVARVHRAEVGRRLRVGVRDGLLGVGTVVSVGEDEVALELQLDTPPPPPLPVTLIVAMPRPKALRRILRAATALGVKRLVICNAANVDKSYFGSPAILPDRVRDELVLGLEQAVDTVLPRVTLEPRFRPFVEDRLTDLAGAATRLVAQPGAAEGVTAPAPVPAALCIGPERGFVAFELTLLERQAFQPVHLGPRVLSTEVAVSAALGRWIASGSQAEPRAGRDTHATE